MPSFLSKVFGRKKQDDNESSREQGHGRVSDASLLEGKFEAVSPTVSPTASNFIEAYANGKANGKDKEKDFGFSLFKTKSGSSFPDDSSKKRYNLPHLSLNLPGPKVESNSRALGVVFEADPDAQILLPDSVIGERRLNPLETLILVRACSQAITARGMLCRIRSLFFITPNVIQDWKPLESCTLIGTLHLRTSNASSSPFSFNLWLPKAQ